MALIHGPEGAYCIDRYEASLVQRHADGTTTAWPGNQHIEGSERELVAVSIAGVKPQGYISGDQAARVCANAGKRLCEAEEWVRACRGPNLTRYPYGDRRTAELCNDRYDKLDQHPVVRLFQQVAPRGADPAEMWHSTFMNDPRLHEMPHGVSATGAFEQCTNAYGVYDMVGNLHEWVADADGTFLGGFFMDTYQNGEGCDYRTVAHSRHYHDYSTGFRCCRDAAGAD